MIADCRFVDFNAPSKSGPGTWGQEQVWVDLKHLGPEQHGASVAISIDLISPVTLSVVCASIKALIERHESLRTQYELTANGELRQIVRGDGRAPVYILPTEDVASAAHELQQHLRRQVFDHATDTPCRFGLLVQDGSVVHLSAVISHMSCDEAAAQLVLRELELLIQGAPARSLAAPCQALDIAAFQHSPAGRRIHDRSLSYHRATMASAPATVFPFHADPGLTPRFWSAELRSIAVSRALTALAARYRLSHAQIATAATARVLTGLHDTRECTLRFVFNNRLSERDHSVVASLSQFGLATVRADQADFAETAVAARRAALLACRHARYGYFAFQRLQHEVEVERDVALDFSCWINVHTPGDASPAAAPYDAGTTAALAEQSTFAWTHRGHHNQVKYYLSVVYEPGGTLMMVDADTRYLSPAHIHDCLLATEDLLLRALHQSG